MKQTPQPLPQPQFDNILNFRDVAASINSFSGSNKLKTGVFFRSARPDEATQHDRDLLTTHYKIRTIIDLRTKSEHIQQVQKHRSRAPPVPTSSLLAPPNPTAASLAGTKIPGLTYAEINFNGFAYSMALIRQLRYWSVTKLIGLMALGYRVEAISILGTEVMAAKGLVGMAIDSLDHCTAEVLSVFQVLANLAAWPVVVHCTQGKDRTGLVVLLVLLLVDAERRAVERDYVRSQRELEPERGERLPEIRSIGLPDEFADCPVDWIERVARHVDEVYGGIEKYLLRCGVTVDMQRKVKEMLMV